MAGEENGHPLKTEKVIDSSVNLAKCRKTFDCYWRAAANEDTGHFITYDFGVPVSVTEVFPGFRVPVSVTEVFPPFLVPVSVTELFPPFLGPVSVTEVSPI